LNALGEKAAQAEDEQTQTEKEAPQAPSQKESLVLIRTA
jgi:hypothetical protein